MIGRIVTGPGLNPSCPKPNRRDVTGRHPLAIAHLLIRRIPSLRGTSNGETTVMTQVLHTHTIRINRGSPAPFSDISPDAPPAPSRSRSSRFRLTGNYSSARWKSSARGSWLGGSCVRLFLTHGWASRGCDQEVAYGRGGVGGGRATRRSRARRPSRHRRTDMVGTRLAGQVLIPYAYHGKHIGDFGRGFLLAGTLFACTFRTVAVVEDHDGTFERLRGA